MDLEISNIAQFEQLHSVTLSSLISCWKKFRTKGMGNT